MILSRHARSANSPLRWNTFHSVIRFKSARALSIMNRNERGSDNTEREKTEGAEAFSGRCSLRYNTDAGVIKLRGRPAERKLDASNAIADQLHDLFERARNQHANSWRADLSSSVLWNLSQRVEGGKK